MARRRLQLAELLPLLAALPLFASGPTGTITGTVADPSGALVPKAHVVVLDEGTNTSRDVETNEDGDYTVALLPPGRYSVSIDKAGFRRSIIHGISVDLDQTVRLDFALRVGPAAEPFGPAFGTEGRNVLVGPGFTNLDFALTKSIALHGENHRLQLRGEFFNLLNHPNFDIPAHTFDLASCAQNPAQLCPAGNYGSILSADSYGDRPPRQIQLSVK